MPQHEARCLRDALNEAGESSARALWAPDSSVSLRDLHGASSLGGRLDELAGRSVLIAAQEQLGTALALIEADGLARRLILCPADLALEHLLAVIKIAEVETILTDRADVRACAAGNVDSVIEATSRIGPGSRPRREPLATEWVLFTSGTTGLPKLVVHTLATLAGAIRPGSALARPAVWCTFYDIRRFGGLQILLRAVLGGGSLVLSGHGEPVGDLLERAASRGATHITGTPSHWRRALMSPAARHVTPQYVRLSGEIADQAVLDSLKAHYPEAKVGHAFASTEAGVAFEVDDGLAGFPASLLERESAEVQMKVRDGSLRIRSPRTALRYLGTGEPLADEDGYIDTGDIVELRDGRYYFAGRRGGIINVGGLKIHPEEVEAVINRHPRVRMSLVKARKNPITGALVVADVVLTPAPTDAHAQVAEDVLKAEILAVCRESLPAHKVPVTVRVVPSLPLTPAGKVARSNA
jgi:acyl-coenzyme A synthetase/AMP-(fatty) acid ligase